MDSGSIACCSFNARCRGYPSFYYSLYWEPLAFVLAFLINLAGITTLIGGIAIGVLIWVGFIVTLEIGELVWEKIPFRLFLLRIGNHLVALSIAGSILAVWR